MIPATPYTAPRRTTRRTPGEATAATAAATTADSPDIKSSISIVTPSFLAGRSRGA
jgi:hypothetical protein